MIGPEKGYNNAKEAVETLRDKRGIGVWHVLKFLLAVVIPVDGECERWTRGTPLFVEGWRDSLEASTVRNAKKMNWEDELGGGSQRTAQPASGVA